MTQHGWVYAEDGEEHKVEVINHARTLAALRANSVPGVFVDILDTDVNCPAVSLNPRREHPGLTLLRQALVWLTPREMMPGNRALRNLGTLGEDANGALGTGDAVDAGDPLVLAHTGVNYAYQPGSTAALTIPDAVQLAAATQLDMRIAVALADYTPAGTNILMSQGDASPISSSFRFYIQSAGVLQVELSEGGVTWRAVGATSNLSAVANAALTILRYTWRQSDQRVQFWWKSSTEATVAADRASNAGWTTLGTVTLPGAVASVFNSTAVVSVGGYSTGGTPLTGGIYSASIATTIDGTPFFELDPTDIPKVDNVTFTAKSLQTVTVVTPTSGFKTVLVTEPTLLLAIDDRITVRNNVGLHFDATESFTMIVRGRQRATPRSNGVLAGMKDPAGTADGFQLVNNGAAQSINAIIDDGPTSVTTAANTTTAARRHTMGMVVNRTTQLLTSFVDATFSAGVSIAAVGSLATSVDFVIGNTYTGTLPQDLEINDVVVLPFAPTAAQVALVKDYLDTRTAVQEWVQYDFTSGVDPAPWYDGTAISSEALGLWVEEWTGLDGAHHTRTQAKRGARPGGASFGPLSHNARVMKVNMLLFASTDRGMRHLFRWFESWLMNACDLRDTTNLWVREVCPASVTTPTEGLAQLRGVVLVEGPTEETAPIDTARLVVKRISFTLAAGDPCIYGPDSSVGSESATWTPTIRTVEIPYGTDGGLSVPEFRPDRSAAPGLVGGAVFSMPSDSLWAAAAPVVTITSDLLVGDVTDIVYPGNDYTLPIFVPDSRQRLLVPALSVYVTSGVQNAVLNAVPYARDEIAESELFARVDLKAFPSGSTIVIDFAARTVDYLDIDLTAPVGQWQDGWRWVADRGTGQPRWRLPPAGCDGTTYVSVRPTFNPVQENDDTWGVVGVADADGNYVGNFNQFSWRVQVDSVARWGCA